MTAQTTPRRAHRLWKEVRVLIPKGPTKQYPDVECLHCHLPVQNVQPSRALLTHIVACPAISENEVASLSRPGDGKGRSCKACSTQSWEASPKEQASTTKRPVMMLPLRN
ncbi:hypothetical protein F443_09557 [Phytophthora nicotianae P1569]|uniref:BED-type domain-containing protein n=2 Tax=Phytophthora nicotianae TaxID=4792 RepID=V9F3B4_PHYNI|nr:hypothetical protein F443_09557 [Phytophthora nicotianae P1569]ETO74728.1 hypothetical protein F444_09621 [Phytophthora nicotianae P1976]